MDEITEEEQQKLGSFSSSSSREILVGGIPNVGSFSDEKDFNQRIESQQGFHHSHNEQNYISRLRRFVKEAKITGLFNLRRLYAIYVLAILFVTYILNQVDRLLLPVLGSIVQKDLNLSYGEFGFLTGFGFTVIYIFFGLLFGRLADKLNRKIVLSIAVIFWSCITGVTGFSRNFWQMCLSRIGLAVGESALAPIAFSLLSDYFDPKYIGTILSVYSFAIYIGYGTCFLLVGVIESILPSWRWSFYLIGVLGIIVGILIIISVREPKKRIRNFKKKDSSADNNHLHENSSLSQDHELNQNDSTLSNEVHSEGDTALSTLSDAVPKVKGNKKKARYTFKESIKYIMLNRSLWIICFAAGCRNCVGYIQTAWFSTFFMRTHNLLPQQQAQYMTWISPVFGVFSVLMGGILSDLLVKCRVPKQWFMSDMISGESFRVLICATSCILSIPFLALILCLPHPVIAMLCNIPYYIVSEMWIGATGATITLISPARMKGLITSLYFFIISLIAGIGPWIIGLLSEWIPCYGEQECNNLWWILLLPMTLLYLFSALFFILSFFTISADAKKARKYEWILSPEDQRI